MNTSSQPQQQQDQQQLQQLNNPHAMGLHPISNNYSNNNNNNNNNNHQSRGRSGRGEGRAGRRGGGRRGGGRGGGGCRGGRSPLSFGNNNFVANKIAPTTGVPFGHVPAYLPGSSSLVEELDQRIMVVLRDGRHLVGTFRSFDQYSNIVLDNVSERRFHNQGKNRNSDDKGENNNNNKQITYFTDVPLGMYIVRGDSIVLLGQVGSEKEEKNNNVVGNSNVSQQFQSTMIVTMKRIDLDEFEAMVAPDEGDDRVVREEGGKGGPLLTSSKSLEWDFDKDLLA